MKIWIIQHVYASSLKRHDGNAYWPGCAFAHFHVVKTNLTQFYFIQFLLLFENCLSWNLREKFWFYEKNLWPTICLFRFVCSIVLLYFLFGLRPIVTTKELITSLYSEQNFSILIFMQPTTHSLMISWEPPSEYDGPVDSYQLTYNSTSGSTSLSVPGDQQWCVSVLATCLLQQMNSANFRKTHLRYFLFRKRNVL